ncbi:hypothetical protein F53441_739 [Fusarium austroafricanum]|uniref:Uncharacterized protein n=1 Tax=Fusarium austroafricanum TaxID=2364996 RepID=A0A8H4KW61_9HYPO|nr:hypothetical protein F53441_739 [Fusarium austroafricanum]
MEDLSSPVSITSSTPTAPTSASKVTYTTAGTPYNPSTSQPLQPPARRGRSLKWPAGLPAAGLSLLPKSVLAALPLKSGSRSSSLQQYSPQTPYDGAPTPLNDTDHRCVNMSAQVPCIGSSATPSPLTSLFSDAEQDTFTDLDPSEGSDDCELSMDPLMNMTVKSLHNLASYPNPNQKRAQKALLRGLKPALGLKVATRSDEPSTPLSRSVGLPDARRNSAGSPNLFNSTNVETAPFGRSYDDTFWNSQGDRSPSILPGAFKSFDRAVGSNSTQTAITLVSGSGTPLPLTAGPPGQRQYRPSTFESTFKALQTNVPSQETSQEEDDDVLVITRQSLRQAGINSTGRLQPVSSFEGTTLLAPRSPQFVFTTAPGAPEDLPASANTVHASAFHAPLMKGPQYPKNSMSSPWASGTTTTSDCWASSLELGQPRYISGPHLRTAKEVEAYNNNINRAWYYGADFLVAEADEIALQVQPPKGKGEFGAVGDGRPSKKGEYHRPIEIDDANRMSVADHARPLFNMAHVNVQKFVDGEWQKSHGGHAAAVQAAK